MLHSMQRNGIGLIVSTFLIVEPSKLVHRLIVVWLDHLLHQSRIYLTPLSTVQGKLFPTKFPDPIKNLVIKNHSCINILFFLPLVKISITLLYSQKSIPLFFNRVFLYLHLIARSLITSSTLGEMPSDVSKMRVNQFHWPTDHICTCSPPQVSDKFFSAEVWYCLR